MKNFIGIFTLVCLIALVSCKNSVEKKSENEEFKLEKKVSIVYFHGERRCPTCIAVGDVAKEVYDSKYNKNNDVAFYDINIEDNYYKKFAEKYEVAGSVLLIIKKSEFEDITGFAFQNATRNPELLKEKIESIVNNYIEN
ncbi:MAG TPA: nitrophenyl compound nitroreductase subunit ArsF family protein [Bacteroidales bacterium]|jgi:thiol-disulfide isomerase/thioredoxin|nr:nitrophenyl compound nitroreductase subunit ArsF family protein [Bacteroidales bacterium]HOL99011.1 nitrophenyl compound nitroreductase subunit ArsF family protein [Bacteroidales bacterium]HOM37354.1 nitrophenyl compound nitroreductase subunit ArsF family protein [Bacteroidales bacterium]HPD24858.1 nitrophenyl compound nitroreductase subunit ArsF family protein [Bacteroidales bacterium]HRS99264.1 nitrophenyl compound nitroreductase subunit ArsF family protein [Bacteroidales bacterium]